LKSFKLEDKIWYFEDVITETDDLDKILTGWQEEINQPFMQIINLEVSDFLECTDNSTFKVLDVWYGENKELHDEDYKLLPYVQMWKRTKGTGFTPHVDFASDPDGSYKETHATILGYLSDPNDYEGGEIFFDDYDIAIKPKKGSMIVFGHKVVHGVNPVTSGTRLISSQHMVKTKDYYKIMGIDPEKMTKENKIKLRKKSPQYENKNGNISAIARGLQ
jgi:hypothetical protein